MYCQAFLGSSALVHVVRSSGSPLCRATGRPQCRVAAVVLRLQPIHAVPVWDNYFTRACGTLQVPVTILSEDADEQAAMVEATADSARRHRRTNKLDHRP